MLVELHNQGQERFVYTCNECKHHVETRWHCTVCEVRNNCISKDFLLFFISPEVLAFKLECILNVFCLCLGL